jgi:hypothetical protein
MLISLSYYRLAAQGATLAKAAKPKILLTTRLFAQTKTH